MLDALGTLDEHRPMLCGAGFAGDAKRLGEERD